MQWATPTPSTFQLTQPNKSAHHNSKVIYNMTTTSYIHSIPNRGNSGVCIITLPHGGTVIHDVPLLRLTCVQEKHQENQVPDIVPYKG